MPRGLYTAFMTHESSPTAGKAQETSIYEIVIWGHISPEREASFAGQGLASRLIKVGEPATLLTGEILDQAHLRGLLNKIWDLNFDILMVRRIRPENTTGGRADE